MKIQVENENKLFKQQQQLKMHQKNKQAPFQVLFRDQFQKIFVHFLNAVAVLAFDALQIKLPKFDAKILKNILNTAQSIIITNDYRLNSNL